MKASSSSQKEDVFQSDIQWQILAALFISSIIFFDYVIMELYICWQWTRTAGKFDTGSKRLPQNRSK